MAGLNAVQIGDRLENDQTRCLKNFPTVIVTPAKTALTVADANLTGHDFAGGDLLYLVHK